VILHIRKYSALTRKTINFVRMNIKVEIKLMFKIRTKIVLNGRGKKAMETILSRLFSVFK